VPTEDDVLHWCSSLIHLNKSSKILELAHFPVKKFLTSIDPKVNPEFAQYQLSNECADVMITQASLICLNWENFENLPIPIDGEDFYLKFDYIADEYPFYLYASDSWELHANQHFDEGQLVELARSLFDPEICNHFRHWALFRLQDENDSYKYSDFYIPVATKLSPLHMATCLALPELCRWLTEEGVPIDEDFGCGIPLWCAMLASQVLAEAPDDFLDLVLVEKYSAAARRSIMELLLEAGSGANKRRDIGFETSLVSVAVIKESWFETPDKFSQLLNAGTLISDTDIETAISEFLEDPHYLENFR
jgi:hypothetical protein